MCIYLVGFSQEYKTVRIEIPTDMQADSYHVESLGERGLLIFYASNEVDKEGKRNWYFGLFDTKLKQQWLKFVGLNDPVEYVQARLNGSRIHLLFRNTGKAKFDYDFYEIVTYDSRTESFSLISGSIPEKAEIAGFEVIDNTACVALNLRKFTTDLVFVNLISGDVSPVHIAESGQSLILALQIDKRSSHFLVAVKMVSDGRYVSDKILIYDHLGVLKTDLVVDNPENIKMLRNFQFFPKENQQLIILGSYDIITGRMASLKDMDKSDDPRSAGFFFLKFEGAQQTKLNFFDFMAFKNIQGTMEAREIVNTRMRNDSTGEKEKQKVVTAYYHLSESVGATSDNKYYLSTEVYKPYYRTETRMDYDYYGRPYPYTYSVFAGYQYYDVLVAAFSDEGNMLWDNELVIQNLLSFKRNAHAILVPDGSTLTVGYVNNGKLFSKTIDEGITVANLDTPVAALFTRDRIIDDDDNVLVHWYDQFYLMYGEQTIRNRALGEQDERTVFYVNKIAFQ
jgi:hypothetical protein